MQLAPQPSKSVFQLSNGITKEEPVFFWRPFSNLPARHVLDGLTDGDTLARSRPAYALFLGCTDPRTIIKSLAVLQLDKGSQQLQLTAVLNDVHAPILARTALLLLMAAELDPRSKADMRVLFDVWFNTIWHADTWPRFAEFTQRLINGSVPWLMPARRQDQQQLQEVWRWWLDEKHPNRPTPAALSKKRAAFNNSNPVGFHGIYKQPSHIIDKVGDKYPPGFRHTVKVLHCTDMGLVTSTLGDLNTLRVNYESTAPKPPHVEQARLALCAVLEGVKQHLETGSLSWDRNRREAGSINITFVEPGTGAWNVHPDQRPFTCWGTYTAEELATAMQAGLKPASALADVFITRMASFVERFQRNTTFHARNSTSSHAGKPVALQVQLICGEALGLCLHDPFSSVSDKASIAQDSSSSSNSSSSSETSALPPLTTFDIIDTGSLCDDVGLLPLLVAVTPRLSNHPAARLHTVPATWALSAPRMDYYVQEQALGMPPSMTPTLLGLRLVTDINYGRPTALRDLVLEAALYDPRELSWAPVPPSQPQPRLMLPDLTTAGTDQYAYKDVQWGPPGSIGAVLQNVCKLCCTTNHYTLPRKHADVAVHLSTPHTFAWMLISCTPRLDMSSLVAEQQQQQQQPYSANLGGRAAITHGILWALRTRVSALLPPHFRLAFQGAIDAVRASLQAAIGPAAAVEAAGVPACKQQSYLMLPISGLKAGELAVAGGVRLRRPFVRALLGATADTSFYTLRPDRVTTKQQEIAPGKFMPVTQVAGQLPDQVYEFAYEGSPLDPPPKKFCTLRKLMNQEQGTWEIPGDDGQTELQVHVLDCCSVPYSKASGWRAAFMIPSDHASMQLPNVSSMLVSVGPGYFGAHDPLKHKYMDIPIQAVSPTLAQCFLHPLLCPSRTCGVAEVSSNSPPALQTVTEASKCSSTLQVTQLIETVWGYEVVLKLQGPDKPSGLSITLPQAATAMVPPQQPTPASLLCTSSHVVEVSLAQPAGVSTQLVLGWPVAAGLGEPEGVADNAYSSGCGVTAKLKKSERVVELTLTKAQVWERWPEDRAPPLLQCRPLAPHLLVTTMAHTFQFMFTAEGSYPDTSQRNLATIMMTSAQRHKWNALRSFIMQSLEATSGGPPFTAFWLYDAKVKGKTFTQGLNMGIIVSNDYQVNAEDGARLVVPAVVVDLALLATMGLPMDALRAGSADHARPGVAQIVMRAAKAIAAAQSLDRRPASDKTTFAAEVNDLNVVRRYLCHNAQFWQPSQWQRTLLASMGAAQDPASPYMALCFATFITPIFAEHMQQFHHCDRVFEELFPAGIPPLGQPLPYPLNTSDAAAGGHGSKAGSEASSSSVAGVHAGLAPALQTTATTKKATHQANCRGILGPDVTAMPAAMLASLHAGQAVGQPTQQTQSVLRAGAGSKQQSSSIETSTRSSKNRKGKKGKAGTVAATNMAGQEGGGAGSMQEQQAVADMAREDWICEKMSELRVDFSHCTDVELRSIAEMAFGMFGSSGNA